MCTSNEQTSCRTKNLTCETAYLMLTKNLAAADQQKTRQQKSQCQTDWSFTSSYKNWMLLLLYKVKNSPTNPPAFEKKVKEPTIEDFDMLRVFFFWTLSVITTHGCKSIPVWILADLMRIVSASDAGYELLKLACWLQALVPWHACLASGIFLPSYSCPLSL